MKERLRIVVALALLVVATGLVASNARVIWQSPLPTALCAAVVAFLSRGRLSDAVMFCTAILIASEAEFEVGPQVLACLSLLILATTSRPRFSIILGSGLLLLLLTSIRLKVQFAGTPLTWQDVHFFFLQFHDNVGVMASQPTLLLHAAGAAVILLAATVVLWRWDRGESPGRGATRRYAGLVMSLALAGWNANQAVGAAVDYRRQGAWLFSETMSDATPISRFLATAFMEPVVAVKAAGSPSFMHRMQRVLTPKAATPAPADIVVFLQESQFNPTTIAGCPEHLCKLSLFEGNKQTLIGGPLRVHVFGGGTWLTEFSFASGVPHTVFGPAGDFAPFNVAPGIRHSFARSLRSAGYRTVAVYPVGGGMMNARAAYEAYGFDKFYDSNDLGLSGQFNTSDELIHDAALRVLAKERLYGKPVFLMAVTIFNHGEHGVNMARVPASLIREAAQSFSDTRVAGNVADYVWRSREFQKVMTNTSHTILHSDKPAVLAWFGDHQPPFGNALPLRGKIRAAAGASAGGPSQYQTWYQVSSNVRNLSAHKALEPLDIVFLPGVLAQTAGASLDDWLAANVAARTLCQGLLQECRDPSVRDAYLSYLTHDLKAFELH